MRFSTRHKVSSNRSNAETWMARLAAARLEPERRGPESRLCYARLFRRCRARAGRAACGERQYMEVLAVRSGAGCESSRNRTARPDEDRGVRNSWALA
jgi:hypothetical protein